MMPWSEDYLIESPYQGLGYLPYYCFYHVSIMNSYVLILFDPNAAMKWSVVDWFSLSKTGGKMY